MHYGPVMIDLEGQRLSPEEERLIRHPAVGGILLFTRNYTSKEALIALIQDIRGVLKNKPLLIAVDHEGGRVWRFEQGFTKLQPARYFGECYDKNAKEGLTLAHQAGFTMAHELLACGLDLSFAPVLDRDAGFKEGGSSAPLVIGDRAFHSNPQTLTLLARAFVVGMNEAGMQATGKHFPGHGGTAFDSHVTTVVDHRPLEIIWQEDLVPFVALHEVLGAMMTAHVVFDKVDSVPSSFSSIWLEDILRKRIGFKGAIISDCLSMKAAASLGGDHVVRARLALEAGSDMVILSQQPRDLLHWVLEKLGRETSAVSHKRLECLAGKFDAKKKAGVYLRTSV